MKKRYIYIILALVLMTVLLFRMCSYTVYSAKDDSFKIRQIQTSIRLIALPGDGQNSYKTILTNRYGVPIKIWDSPRFDIRWGIGKVLYNKDSSYLFMDACYEGCFHYRYLVSDWSLQEKKSSIESYNKQILDYYKQKAIGVWSSAIDTIEIKTDTLYFNKKKYLIKWIRDYSKNQKRLFAKNSKDIIYGSNGCDIGFDVSDSVSKFMKIEEIDNAYMKILYDRKHIIYSKN